MARKKMKVATSPQRVNAAPRRAPHHTGTGRDESTRHAMRPRSATAASWPRLLVERSRGVSATCSVAATCSWRCVRAVAVEDQPRAAHSKHQRHDQRRIVERHRHRCDKNASAGQDAEPAPYVAPTARGLGLDRQEIYTQGRGLRSTGLRSLEIVYWHRGRSEVDAVPRREVPRRDGVRRRSLGGWRSSSQ